MSPREFKKKKSDFPFGLSFMLHTKWKNTQKILTLCSSSLSLQATFPGNGVCIFTTFELSVESWVEDWHEAVSRHHYLTTRNSLCCMFSSTNGTMLLSKKQFSPSLSYILVKNIEFVTWCDPVTEACRTYTPSQTQFWLNRFQVGKGVSD